MPPFGAFASTFFMLFPAGLPPVSAPLRHFSTGGKQPSGARSRRA